MKMKMKATGEGDRSTLVNSPTLWLPDAGCANELANLDAQCYANSLNSEQWRRLLKKRTALTIVAGEQKLWIAYAYAQSLRGEIELLRCGVAEGRRREGWGELLVSVLGEATDLRLSLRETNDDGLKWARAVGFRATGVQRANRGSTEPDWISLVRPQSEKFAVRG
jgi:hypothetical protein